MWKYNGSGFIIGIPARDLTDEEAERFGIVDNDFGLYDHVTPVNKADDKGENKWQESKHSEKSRSGKSRQREQTQ